MGLACADDDAFARSRAQFEEMLGFLGEDGAAKLDHGELEDRLDTKGRELLRRLYQDHLDLRAAREQRLDQVADAEGLSRPSVEAGHGRALTTIFGRVGVTRLAYRRRGQPNLHPADGVLNLPEERHSHGLRRLAATEAARARSTTPPRRSGPATGAVVAKRQVEQLAALSAVDFEAFYASRPRPEASAEEVVVISVDGKGIVMRPGALRPATASAAERTTTKLEGRLSKGEKRNRKRMAEVGAVYTVVPVPRGAGDVLASAADDHPRKAAPTAKDKWLTASVVDDAASVVGRVFDEAERSDPAHRCAWVALVDGNNHQIDRIRAEAAGHGVKVSIVVDLVHVLEYLWSAAWSFFVEGDPAAEVWVRDKAMDILGGRASIVAASIRRKATCLGLDDNERANADRCADYLLNKAPYLDYVALSCFFAGWLAPPAGLEPATHGLGNRYSRPQTSSSAARLGSIGGSLPTAFPTR